MKLDSRGADGRPLPRVSILMASQDGGSAGGMDLNFRVVSVQEAEI